MNEACNWVPMHKEYYFQINNLKSMIYVIVFILIFKRLDNINLILTKKIFLLKTINLI